MWDSGFLRLNGYGACTSPWIQLAAGAHRLVLLGHSLGATDMVQVQVEHERSEGVSVAGVRAELAGTPATVWTEGADQPKRSRLRVEWQAHAGAVIRIGLSHSPAAGA